MYFVLDLVLKSIDILFLLAFLLIFVVVKIVEGFVNELDQVKKLNFPYLTVKELCKLENKLGFCEFGFIFLQYTDELIKKLVFKDLLEY